jgi:histidine ammonia-lyase
MLAVPAPILTAIRVEATLGTTESFHPFISSVQPQRSQVEVAQTILGFLKGSKVASIGDSSVLLSRRPHHDSYALRTSSKWLGPVLEDLGLARSQIEIELNSTTDDPDRCCQQHDPSRRKFPSILDNFVNRDDKIVPRQNWKTTLCSKHRASGCRLSLQPSAESRS